jgi:hypothetical protein
MTAEAIIAVSRDRFATYKVSGFRPNRPGVGRLGAYFAAMTVLAVYTANILGAPRVLTKSAMTLDLEEGVKAALVAPRGGVGDPADAFKIHAVDPQSRAREALYLAALLRPREGVLVLRETYSSEPSIDKVVSATLRMLQLGQTSRPRGVAASFTSDSLSINAMVREAAGVVGVDPRFLSRTAQRESAWNIYAASPRSSARGLFQFIEQTWLLSVSRFGDAHGLGHEARLIEIDRSGRAFVRDLHERRRILAMRYDPIIASRLAAELTAENQRFLARDLGRPPTERELYAAHVLGAAGAIKLIRYATIAPGFPAARLFPNAAAANRSLFFRSGRVLGLAEVLNGFG